MTARPGRDLLLKIAGPSGFVTVAGLRARRIVLDAAVVDATDADSAGRWRELLTDAGVRRASLSGSGIFRDGASDMALREAFFSGTAPLCQVVMPGIGTLQGPFQITRLDYSGDHDGAMGFEIALESAGALTLEALA